MSNLAADRAAGLVSYLQTGDPVSDGLLDGLVRGLLDPADRLSLVAHGDGDTILKPWAAITDPRIAPLWAIPHCAQWMGGIPPVRRAGETDDEYLARARAELIHPRGMLRGGSTSLRIVAQSFLTGTQTVRIVEIPDGDLWGAVVLVKTSEIADRTGLLEAALNDPEIVPAGFAITVIPDDAPLVDEGTLTFDSVDIAVDVATISDVT